MRLSIVTVNYNNSDSTLKLLESLINQTNQDFQIIVIDNASEEADFNNLRQNVDNTTLVRNNDNLGFSGGNNVGIKEALKNGAEWVVLLNNDTWAEDGFISSLKAKLTGLGGIVGLPLDEGGQIAYCGRVEWLKPTLKHAYQLTSPDGKAIEDPRQSRDLPAYQLYAIGGAVAIRKEVFEKIGFWDEKYFLYFEDADFSLRAKKAGIPVTIVPDVVIHHNTSSTTKKLGSSLLLRYHYRNALYFNLKNGPWYIKLAVWIWSFWIIKKQILKIMCRYKTEESHAILNGVFDFYHYRMGKIKTG